MFPRAEGRAGRLRLVGQLRDLVQPGAAARAARAGGTYFAQGYSGHGVVGSHLFGRILARGGARRPVAIRRFREGAVDPVSRAAGASPCPIPCSARGGMGCATASACEPISERRMPRMNRTPAPDGPRGPAGAAGAGAGQRAARLQLVRLHRRGHGREVRGGDRDQGRLRRLRLERGAGGEAARRQLGLRRGGADLAASCSGRSAAGRLPAARQVEAAEPREHGPGADGAGRPPTIRTTSMRSSTCGARSASATTSRRSRSGWAPRTRRSTAGRWSSTRSMPRSSPTAASRCSIRRPTCCRARSPISGSTRRATDADDMREGGGR